MRRKPTNAMLLADEKRIAKARALRDVAFDAALVGCPGDMGCGTWIDKHAVPELRAAYRDASEKLTAAEQAAVNRGTMYHSTFGALYPISWGR